MALRAMTVLAAALGIAVNASADEGKIRVGAIDAVLAIPNDIEHPPVALLIGGSGPTDHDGNGPGISPATLKKLSEQLSARKIAVLRYDKRGRADGRQNSESRKISASRIMLMTRYRWQIICAAAASSQS